MQDITHKLGSNQFQAKEKFTTKAIRFIKLALVNLLVLTAVGMGLYAKTVQYGADKDKEILNAKIQLLEAERDTLKPQGTVK